jgi:hypothetical protein
MTDSPLLRRLAAANPVPAGTVLDVAPFAVPQVKPRRLPRRSLVVLAALAAIAAPAAAFSGTLTDLLGFSNAGTAVPAEPIFDQAAKLTAAEGELQFPAQVQDLGNLDGTTFYVTKNAAGDNCFALSGNVQAIWCLLDQPFPSAERPIIGLPIGQNDPGGDLVGFAADGVARVDLDDPNGNVVASAPVSDNIYQATFTPNAQISAVIAYDADGNVVYTHELGPGPWPTDH